MNGDTPGEGEPTGDDKTSRRKSFAVAADVAKRAGVSTATVSRVLNGSAGVSAKKRAAVLKAAEDLDFVANGAARALSTKRFMTIGAVVPNIENEGFLKALSAFQARLRHIGYTLVLTNSGYDLDVELREATALLSRGVDGLLLVGDIHRAELFAMSERMGVPLVQTFTLSAARPCVGFDNVAATRRAAQFLLDLGHRRIAVVTGSRRDNDRAQSRVEGVRSALAARGLSIHPAHDVIVSYGIGAGRDAMRHILGAEGVPRPTAIVCGTDQLAFGVMIEAQSRGLEVPRDLSITGFNDADYAAFLSPPLTTLRIRATEIGQAAADYLAACLRGETAVRVTDIAAELIVRESTAPPPDRERPV